MNKKINLFHFFSWNNTNGWQHLGYSDGYETLEECKKDNDFYIKNPNRKKWKIMKLEVAEEVE